MKKFSNEKFYLMLKAGLEKSKAIARSFPKNIVHVTINAPSSICKKQSTGDFQPTILHF